VCVCVWFAFAFAFRIGALEGRANSALTRVLHLIDPLRWHQAFFCVCADKFGGRAGRQKGGSDVD
jgi:hypothetical protein